MKSRRSLLAATTCFLVLLLCTTVIGVSAAGTATPAPPRLENPEEGQVIVEKYECLFPVDGSYVSQIRPDTAVDIHVWITDTRIRNTEAGPYAYLNTGSFVSRGDAINRPGDAILGNVSDTGNGITYELLFPVYYTGLGNSFAFDLNYSSNQGVALWSYQLSLNQCVELDPTSSDPNSDPIDDPSNSTITRGTGFVLKSASYGGGEISLGSNFTLDLLLLSTNGSHNVENVYVTITPSKEIALADGTSVFYVGTVSPNQEIPVSFLLEPGNVEEEGSYKVTIDVKGVDSQTGSEVAASMDIAIPIVFSERFEIFNVQLPDFITANSPDGPGYVSISLVNKGKGTINNVSAAITGEGLATEEGNQYIGHIEAGGQKNTEFTLMATQTGELAGQIVITYEDIKGTEKKLTHTFTIMAEESMDPGEFPSGIEEPEETSGLPVWGRVLIIAVLLAGIGVAAVLINKRNQAKKEAALLDDLAEDDEEYLDEDI